MQALVAWAAVAAMAAASAPFGLGATAVRGVHMSFPVELKPAVRDMSGDAWEGADGPGGRRARMLAGTTEYVNVHGSVAPLGYFWSYVEIGTPPQKFSVILDTGSSLTAVPCKDCSACGTHMDPRFNPGASRTARYLGCGKECPGTCYTRVTPGLCHYSQGYSEGSRLEGFYITDKFWVGLDGAPHAVDFTFGCHKVETKLFKTQLADGIMGLAARQNTIVSVLQKVHQLPTFEFALCLGTEGGRMSIGGVNASMHRGATLYTPLVNSQSSSFYQVVIKDMTVNGKSAGVPSTVYQSGGGTIIDSGTTFTYVPTRVFTALRALLAAYCGDSTCATRVASPFKGEMDCYDFPVGDAAVLGRFPMLRLVLNGATVSIAPKWYLYVAEPDKSPGVHCVGILDNGANRGTVMGANFMRGYDVLFDRAKARVGFAPAACTPLDEPCPECLAEGNGHAAMEVLAVSLTALTCLGFACLASCECFKARKREKIEAARRPRRAAAKASAMGGVDGDEVEDDDDDADDGVQLLARSGGGASAPAGASAAVSPAEASESDVDVHIGESK